MKINCINPKLIVHYKALAYIIRYREFVIDGKLTNLDEFPLEHVTVGYIYPGINFDSLREKERKRYSRLSDYITFIQFTLNKIINENYVIDRLTGESFPIFQMVPCGKCRCCREKRFQEWTTRCTMESQLYDHPPLFFTLTYDEDHVTDGLLHRDHVTKWIKRFRQVIKRDGLPLPREDLELRLYGHAEYGSRYDRPHIHFLLWNYPVCKSKFHTLNYIKSVVNITWLYGDRPSVKPLDISYSKDAGKYVSRYLSKPSKSVKEIKSPSFFIRPCRPALGKVFFKENLLTKHYNNPHLVEIVFTDKHTNTVVRKPFYGYFKNLTFPTLSRIVRSEDRKEFVRVFDCLTDLVRGAKSRIRRGYFSDLTHYNFLLNKLSRKSFSYLDKLWRFVELFEIDVGDLFRNITDADNFYYRHLRYSDIMNGCKGSLKDMLSRPDSFFAHIRNCMHLSDLHSAYRASQPVNMASNPGSYALQLLRDDNRRASLEFASSVF